MIRIVLLTTAIVTGVAVTTGAEARGNTPGFGGFMGPMERPSFAELDADGDGKVTAEEFKTFGETRLSAHFTKTDADGDGKLSTEEMQAGLETQRAAREAARAQAMVERFDTDGDGFVSQEEIAEIQAARDLLRRNAADPGARMIARFDADGDGTLSAEEFARVEDMAGRGFRGQRGDFGQRGGRGDRGHGPRGDWMPFWRQ